MTTLLQKISETKVTLGMDNKRLSLALGHQRNYIGRVLSKPHAPHFEKRLFKELDALVESKKIKVADLPAFVLTKEQCDSCRDLFCGEAKKLKEHIEYKDEVIDKSHQTNLLAKTKVENLTQQKTELEKQLEMKTEILNRANDRINFLQSKNDIHERASSKYRAEIKDLKEKLQTCENFLSESENELAIVKNKMMLCQVVSSVLLFLVVVIWLWWKL